MLVVCQTFQIFILIFFNKKKNTQILETLNKYEE